HFLELRALALVNAHCIDRFVRWQASCGQRACLAASGREKCAQRAVPVGPDQAHIAVVELELMIVLGDENGATSIPLRPRRDDRFALERSEQALVDALDAERPLAVRAEYAKVLEALQGLFGAARLHPVAKARDGVSLESLEQRLGFRAPDQREIIDWLRAGAGQQGHGCVGSSSVHREGKARDAAVGAEAVALR